jgi:Zn-dependent protease with chaperone function
VTLLELKLLKVGSPAETSIVSMPYALVGSVLKMLRRQFLLVWMVTITVACAARQPGSPIKPGFNMFSKDQDVQLGREAAQQVRQQYQVVQNQDLQNYISRIGQRLASQPEASNFPYSFTLLNDKSVNAFALPGGPTFVFTGLLAAADNEAQLAGVLAHEISHVALRHGTNQVSKANLISLPATLAGAVVGNGSLLGQLTQLGIGLGANSILLKYSRDAESQADALGAHIMAGAGYNPLEMARFFEKLQAEGGSRAPQFLSDHPNPGNRMNAIEAEIRTLPQRNYGYETGEFARAKSLIGGIPAAPRQRSNLRGGAESPDVRPSGALREFRGPQYSVRYPENWQVFGDNNSSMVTIAPREGLVQDSRGQTSVGYGAMLSYYFPESRGDLRSATDELIHHLHASNPGMQAAGSQRRTRVDGSDGLVTMMASGSPFGGTEQDALVTVTRPQGLFYMVFVAPQSDFRNLQGTFEQMMGSIRFNR